VQAILLPDWDSNQRVNHGGRVHRRGRNQRDSSCVSPPNRGGFDLIRDGYFTTVQTDVEVTTHQFGQRAQEGVSLMINC
jgi:hypothetical protein